MPNIFPILQKLHPVLSFTNIRRLHRIVAAMLCLSGRITQLSISRWAGKGGSYRSVQRFFQSQITWREVLWLLFKQFLYRSDATYLLVGDETVIGKSGKKTHGLDRFYSSIFQKPIAGLAFFTFALVSVQQRQAYPLCAEQVERSDSEKEQARQQKEKRKASAVSAGKKNLEAKKTETKKKAGRPAGSKNKNKSETVLSAELERILLWGQQVLAMVGGKICLRHLVLDGHFGNHPACHMAQRLGLHLISKMRTDAALFREPTEDQKKEHPRLKYGDKLDYGHLPGALRVSSQDEGGIRTEVFQVRRCWHRDFAGMVNVVIIVKTNLDTGRWGHVILFSSDLDLEASTLIDYYQLRFQIEFDFRDAKQHWGLDDFMAVSKTAVTNAVGLSFFMVDLSAYLLEHLRQGYAQAGINDLKSYFRGRRYVDETIKCLPDLPDTIVWRSVWDQVCLLGFIHPTAKTGQYCSPKAFQTTHAAMDRAA